MTTRSVRQRQVSVLVSCRGFPTVNIHPPKVVAYRSIRNKNNVTSVSGHGWVKILAGIRELFAVVAIAVSNPEIGRSGQIWSCRRVFRRACNQVTESPSSLPVSKRGSSWRDSHRRPEQPKICDTRTLDAHQCLTVGSQANSKVAAQII